MTRPARECALLECDQPAVTVLAYSTHPHREYPLCGPHRVEALAWIRARWGASVTITETQLTDRAEVVQPALFTTEVSR